MEWWWFCFRCRSDMALSVCSSYQLIPLKPVTVCFIVTVSPCPQWGQFLLCARHSLLPPLALALGSSLFSLLIFASLHFLSHLVARKQSLAFWIANTGRVRYTWNGRQIPQYVFLFMHSIGIYQANEQGWRYSFSVIGLVLLGLRESPPEVLVIVLT